MRYANISKIPSVPIDDRRYSFNIGDYMQIFAIENIYRKMRIPQNEIQYIRLSDVRTYVGEHLILPICSMLGKMADVPIINEDGDFCISDYIIPVFLSICIYKNGFDFTEHNIDYLTKHGPIGCRDWNTFAMMRKHGIPSYFSGCLSMTLDERKDEVTDGSVYFVDAPEFIRPHVPNSLFTDAKYIHHIIEVTDDQEKDEWYTWNYSLNLLKEYRDRARLVVTSRLHAACPCIAMGIPTIVAREYKGYTFDWLDRFTTIFDKESVGRIDWAVKKLEFEKEKQLFTDVAIKRIQEVAEKERYHVLSDIYSKWYGRDLGYKDSQLLPLDILKDRINCLWEDRKEHYRYAIWGITETAEEIYSYICLEYPNAELAYVIDTYRNVSFHGLESIKPTSIRTHDKVVIIVTSLNAINSAYDCFKRINKPQEEYILMTDTFMDGD